MKRILRAKLILFGVLLSLAALPFGPPDAAAQSKHRWTLFPSAARTATANGTTQNISGAQASKVIAYLDSAAGTGTTPTLDVKLQDSPDGVLWADIASGAFTQVTTTASKQRLAPAAAVSNFLRAVATIGGTTPSFTFQVLAVTYFAASASLHKGYPPLPGYERDVGRSRRFELPSAA